MFKFMIVVIEPTRIAFKLTDSVDTGALYKHFVLMRHFHLQIYKWGIDDHDSLLLEHYYLVSDMPYPHITC